MGQHTPLFAAHAKAGGQMVEFANWALPIHYGSQLDEHHQVRNDAGIFDVSHMTIVDLSGSGTHDCLRKLLANDVAKLTQPGRGQYTLMLNEEGGIIDDLIVYYLAKNHYRLVFNAATRESVLAWVTLQLLHQHVELTLRDELAMLAVQGPRAIERLASVLTPADHAIVTQLKRFATLADNHLFIAKTGYTGETGVEIMLEADAATDFFERCIEAGIKPCGLGARDTLRLEAGLNLYGQDMSVQHHPYESNLGWTVSLTDDRDFVGKQACLNHRDENHPVLKGIVLEGKGVLRPGMAVHTDAGEGVTTSGTFSPTLQKGIAMARVPQTQQTQCEVEVRGKRLSAQLIDLPFVKNGQANFVIQQEQCYE